MSSSTQDLDSYLDDTGFDLSSYDDYDSYYPTPTGYSSSYPTSSSYDSSDLDDWLDSYLDSSDSSSSNYDSSNYDSSSYEDSSSSDLPSSYSGDYASAYDQDYSNYPTSDKCVSSAAFKDSSSKVNLAFDVVFLVLYIVVMGIAAIRFLKSKRKGAALGKWFLFAISIVLGVLYLILDMITLILSQCVMLRPDHYQLALIAVAWFDSLSMYLLIALVLLPICLKLQQGGGILKTITLIVHSVWLGLCGILLVVALAIHTRMEDALYRSHEVSQSIVVDLPKASINVTMAYYVFLFIAALLASANMVLALFRKANIRKGALILGIPALIFSFLALTLVQMSGFADTYFGKMDRSLSYFEHSGQAQIFLIRLFYALAFLSALVIAGSHQAIDESAPETVETESKAVPPEYNPVSAPGGVPGSAVPHPQPGAYGGHVA